MDIYYLLKQDIEKILLTQYPHLEFEKVRHFVVEEPKNEKYGDLSTNIALVSAKSLQTTPFQIAHILIPLLEEIDYINTVSIEGGGFINFTIENHMWYKILTSVLSDSTYFGKSDIGKNLEVNLEYVSANPTGPLHIGHTRGAIYGDALAGLLKFTGFNVTKEYYINDAGGQIAILTQSLYLRYLEIVHQKSLDLPPGFYPGQYLIDAAQQLYEQYVDSLERMTESERSTIIKAFALKSMMKLIKDDLNALNIKHDIFFSEQNLHDSQSVSEAIAKLEKLGLVYKDILEPPKGKLPEDWVPREQLLFRSSDFGDDVDRPLTKEDKSWTYFASDIAYAENKIQRGFKLLIYILGADHGGYVARTKAIINALSQNQVQCNIKLCQLVKFVENGKPLKMSKRRGVFASARDVIQEVGGDVVRFIMLTRKNDIELEFDIVKTKEQSKDNPVFYVQYAYVRSRSLLAKIDKTILYSADLELLSNKPEMELIKTIASFPNMIKYSAIACEPHRVAFYLINLASKFHTLWNYSEDGKFYRFIVENDKDITASRLYLVRAVQQTIKNGLSIIGINPLERM